MIEATQQGVTIALLLFNLAAYFIGSFLGKGINFFAKRNAVNRPLLGIVGILGVTGFFLIVSLGTLHSQQSALDKLPPFERGLIEGQIIGRAVTPGLLVLVGVGVAGWFRRKKAMASSPPDSNRATLDVRTSPHGDLKSALNRFATTVFWIGATILGAILLLALIGNSVGSGP